ncbi:hypothetical protein [Flavicella sp.]|uniref:OmpP1/FadL family transporter n=1 Tax=Flavicella sp. TaxID=2957742 RepID=UPI00261240B1|nr:hypothetical protein [Flavicella sp.]MDG1804453.1 hypothetical protein [Flavicella sp.]
MKKIYLFSVLFVVSSTLLSQSISYTDLGVLFSQENYNGSARYNAMSGAFGALGGELSSMYQNPAGGAVFARTEISLTYSQTNLNTDASYYGKTSYNSNSSARFPQFGMAIVFDAPYQSSDWSKFTLGFNYSMINDFRGDYTTRGNNGNFVRYDLHPYDDTFTPYNIPDEQIFQNTTHGKHEVYNFSLSSAYKDFFYIGAAMNFHTLEFSQETYLTEYNSDENGNTLDAFYDQFVSEESTGVSLGIGVILKPFRNLRLGVAYQSPVWHPEVIEESNAIDYDTDNSYTGFQEQGYLNIISSDISEDYSNTNTSYPELLTYRYNLNTPEKWTASAAITLGQHGLISVDYHQKNYSLIRLKDGYNFGPEAEEISNTLTTARGVRGGGELRFNQISLRGGAFLEESPYKSEEDSIYKKGVSAGLGLKFKHAKLDFAYQYTEIDGTYSIYHSSEPVNDISLLNASSRITTTLSFTF